MLKLHQQFFRISLVFIVIASLIATVFSYFFVKNSRVDATIDKLSAVVRIASEGNLDKSYLNKISKLSDSRVTYIDKSGELIYDSLRSKNQKPNDNLLNRVEIMKAQKSGQGSSLRYSKKFKRDFIYVAKRLKSGYLRVSKPLDEIKWSIYRVVFEIVVILTMFLVVLIYFTNKLSLKISKDTKAIDEALNSMLKKDFSIYLSNINCCKEFAKVAKNIEKVAKRLKKREKQKSRYTKRLKEITKRQGDIISAISHEFKNPVAAIVGYSQTLQDTPNLNESLKSKFLSKIESNAVKISNMIDTLSLSIKLESNSISLNVTNFNLQDVVNEAVDTLKQKYKDRDIVIECSDVKVDADRNMMENVFINLIENALKYSEDEVIVRCNKEIVEVVDYGIGIDSSDIKKIKDKFYRADGISWNNSIGVGLYIVDYILKLHNLELYIKSDDKETLFSFEIDKIVNS